MSDNLHLRWKYSCGDWVSSLAALPDQLIAYGTREAGTVALLDWLGAEHASQRMGSWVGALSLVADQVVVSGSKSGEVQAFRLNPAEGRRLHLFWQATLGNTVRSIDTLAAPDGGHLIAMGSEDKTVRCYRLGTGPDAAVTSAFTQSPNGWIRAVAFGVHGPGGRPFLAAGCGDKHIHFFGLDGAPIGKTYVGAKTHWIATDRSEARLYAVTDALELLVLDTARVDFRIRKTITVPFRPLICLDYESPSQFVLLICDYGKILFFEPRTERLTTAAEVSDLVTAACVASDRRGAAVLLGTASGSVGLYDVDLAGGSIRLPEPFSPLSAPVNPSPFELYALALTQGPVPAVLEVGICRFIDVVKGNDRLIAILGTDEGEVLVIDVADLPEYDKVLARQKFDRERVWSVAGAWAGDGRLHVWTGSSDRMVREFVLDLGAEPGAASGRFVQIWAFELADWPREIRLVEGGGPGEICAACENGEVAILQGGALLHSSNFGRTLRTILCRREDEGHALLVGSDQGDVIASSGGTEQWRLKSEDRVREILALEDGYAIASEDRFVTITDRGGAIRHRLKLPHRVLCVDAWTDPEGERTLYAGCGDGWVYAVKPNGAIGVAYRFPDRIRDIRLLTAGDFLVASEDRKLYLAEELGGHVERKFGRDEPTLIQEAAEALASAYDGSGTRTFPEQSDASLFALLATTRTWLTAERRLAVASDLVSHAAGRLADYGELRKIYILGAAIADIGARFDPALALAKLRSFTHPEQTAYLLHAVITSVEDIAKGGDARHLAVLQHAIETLRPQPLWVWNECAAALLRQGWGALDGGFMTLFRTAPVHFSRLERLVEVAIGISDKWSLPPAGPLDIRRLRSFAMTPAELRQAAEVMGLVWHSDTANLVEQLRGQVDLGDQVMPLLNKWLDRVAQASEAGANSLRQFLVEHLTMSLLSLDPLIKSRDYAIILLFAAIIQLPQNQGPSS